MKIGVLTWLYNGNYGSILQAYALQRYLRNKNYIVESINYKPSTKEKVINLVKNKNSLRLFIDKIDIFMMKIIAKENVKAINEKFDGFRTDQFCLTACYRSPDEITEIEGKYDVYLCGSDQIWSPMLLNPVYYFDFLKKNDKLISYACSFGVNNVPVKKKTIIANLLEKFDSISVRELQGKDIVADLLGKDVDITVDPTLLLSSKEWDAVATDRIVKEDYVVCYFLSYSRA